MISKITTIFNYNYFFTTPEDSRLVFFWLAFYVLIFILSFVFFFIYKERAKVEKPYKTYAKSIFWTNLSLSLTGLLFLFFRFEEARYISWRIWHYLIVLMFIIVNPYFFVVQKKKLEDSLIKYREQKRKEKWLIKGKKKK